jgi:hypothetical protein
MVDSESANRQGWLATGWNIAADDDVPNVPEAGPLDSAQRKRWALESQAYELHSL